MTKLKYTTKNMNDRLKDLLERFNELTPILYEVLGDCNKALSENIELKKEIAWFKKYTDALVEHKDMVCLPADLRNLREANAALATENNQLKKQVDYLLKKMKACGISNREPKQEELNSLFMDKQNMYVNPEKHTGGIKSEKDIEFDGDKLVDSVEEAASKLKSIQEHNDYLSKQNVGIEKY